ncbi:MAG: hypothetical protein V1726_02010 [Methanobacteriota archaeon]
MERTKGMIVGFGTLGLVVSLKSVFSSIHNPLFTGGLLVIVVGIPLFLSSKKKLAGNTSTMTHIFLRNHEL